MAWLHLPPFLSWFHVDARANASRRIRRSPALFYTRASSENHHRCYYGRIRNMGSHLSRPKRKHIPIVPSLPVQSIHEYIEGRWNFGEIDVDEADDLHELLLKTEYEGHLQRHFLNTLVTPREKWTTTAWTESFLDTANQLRSCTSLPSWDLSLAFSLILFDLYQRATVTYGFVYSSSRLEAMSTSAKSMKTTSRTAST